MPNIFEKFPLFIESDIRSHRPVAYTVTAEFMSVRFDLFFKNIDLTGKSVLDLGCNVGALGAWVLDQGASHYHGVEASKDFCDKATQNLESYFEPCRWKISNQYIEDFIPCLTSYDIIVASGVIYCFFDPISVIKTLANYCSILIIESAEPTILLPAGLQRFLLNLGYLKNNPIILFNPEQPVTWKDEQKDIVFNGSRPSSGFFKYYLDLLGFDCIDINTDLQSSLPDVYNDSKRFAYQFVKNTEKATKSLGMYDGVVNNRADIKFKKWTDYGNSTKA